MKSFTIKLTLIVTIFVAASSTHALPYVVNDTADMVRADGAMPAKVRVFELKCIKNEAGVADVENVVSKSYDKRIEIENNKIMQIASFYLDDECKNLHRAHFRIGVIRDSDSASGPTQNKNIFAAFTDFVLVKDGVLSAQSENLLMVEKVENNGETVPAEVAKIGLGMKSATYYTSDALPIWLAERNRLVFSDDEAQVQLMGTIYKLRIK